MRTSRLGTLREAILCSGCFEIVPWVVVAARFLVEIVTRAAMDSLFPFQAAPRACMSSHFFFPSALADPARTG